MAITTDSFFRVFQPDVRQALRWLFENRQRRTTPEMAVESVDSATLSKLVGLGFIEYDADTSDYRLDDRVERFFEEMLGASEAAQADWLLTLIQEIRRSIAGYEEIADPRKSGELIRRVCRQLRTCDSRMKRHIEDLRTAIDYTYRTGSDYELKHLKLKWHLERTRIYGAATDELSLMLRQDNFFTVHKEHELVTLRARLIQRCMQAGDALIDVYQCIEDYLNRTMREYARARKLITLLGILDRHELGSTNIQESAAGARGPWFQEFRSRTLLSPTLLDSRPDLVDRALERAGAVSEQTQRKVEIEEAADEAIPPSIDWKNVYENYRRQPMDLFRFLCAITVEGRNLTEEEKIDGYCAILTNEEWADDWKDEIADIEREGSWEFAVIKPPTLMTK